MEVKEIKSNHPALIADSFTYKTKKGLISLIPPCQVTFDKYEICGYGFDDVERYDTFNDAMDRINKLLND